MKIKILLFGILLTAHACDRLLSYDFIIDNNCNKPINIGFENMNGYKVDTIIDSNLKNFKIYTNTGYGRSVSQEEMGDLSRLFKYFEITSDSIISKINYKSNDVWQYSEISETHAVYYLQVDSMHFK
jgi:hypothetical protein